MSVPRIHPRRPWASLALALALVLGGAFGAPAASASPNSPCREAICADTLRVGPVQHSWASPEVFYPNNEDVFAHVYVGRRPLGEVRRYGPALCRHRFFGGGMKVVIKACGARPPLRVRAIRFRRGSRALRIAYSARPMIGADTELAATGSIFDGLRQITGLTG